MAEAVSYSQFGQDRFVAETIYRGKRGGYFVEAGAGDGLWISNTLLLERQYGWTGILIEPTGAFAVLQRNRPGCICDSSGLASERSTLAMVEIFDLARMNSYWGIAKKQYLIEARPLAEVLREHGAPKQIDYLSLDVEGFEMEILRRFPFDEYQFGCLSVERPPPDLHNLLHSNGYVFRCKLGEDAIYCRGA